MEDVLNQADRRFVVSKRGENCGEDFSHNSHLQMYIPLITDGDDPVKSALTSFVKPGSTADALLWQQNMVL